MTLTLLLIMATTATATTATATPTAATAVALNCKHLEEPNPTESVNVDVFNLKLVNGPISKLFPVLYGTCVNHSTLELVHNGIIINMEWNVAQAPPYYGEILKENTFSFRVFNVKLINIARGELDEIVRYNNKFESTRGIFTDTGFRIKLFWESPQYATVRLSDVILYNGTIKKLKRRLRHTSLLVYSLTLVKGGYLIRVELQPCKHKHPCIFPTLGRVSSQIGLVFRDVRLKNCTANDLDDLMSFYKIKQSVLKYTVNGFCVRVFFSGINK